MVQELPVLWRRAAARCAHRGTRVVLECAQGTRPLEEGGCRERPTTKGETTTCNTNHGGAVGWLWFRKGKKKRIGHVPQQTRNACRTVVSSIHSHNANPGTHMHAHDVGKGTPHRKRTAPQGEEGGGNNKEQEETEGGQRQAGGQAGRQAGRVHDAPRFKACILLKHTPRSGRAAGSRATMLCTISNTPAHAQQAQPRDTPFIGRE